MQPRPGACVIGAASASHVFVHCLLALPYQPQAPLHARACFASSSPPSPLPPRRSPAPTPGVSARVCAHVSGRAHSPRAPRAPCAPWSALERAPWSMCVYILTTRVCTHPYDTPGEPPTGGLDQPKPDLKPQTLNPDPQTLK